MRSSAVMVFAVACAIGGGRGQAIGAEFGDPLPGLSAEQLVRFEEGRDAFSEVEGPAEGLGPVFNGTSCAGCHGVGAVGGGSDTVETRFGAVSRRGGFDPLASLGGSLIQTDGIGAQGACTFVGEVVPKEANVTAGRRTTPLFGLGLVEAVPDEVFVAIARLQARFTPATAGRPSIVTGIATGKPAVGRFGWKAQVSSLLDFSADAYLNEMGITTPLFPEESCPQGDCSLLVCDPVPGMDDDMEDVELFRDFMAFLAPPPRQQLSDAAIRGSRLFDQVGCADCHLRTLATGYNPDPAFRFQTFNPYSDFLLHDMGSLTDGIVQGGTRAREMRTSPLWGLRLMTTFLHDGRAHSIEGAILAHDGQGRGARNRFAALAPDQKTRLLAFLGSL